jgi:hypothetical protein
MHPPEGKPFEVPPELLAEGGVVDGFLVAQLDEAVVDLLLDVGEAIRSSRGGLVRPGALADALLKVIVVLHRLPSLRGVHRDVQCVCV